MFTAHILATGAIRRQKQEEKEMMKFRAIAAMLATFAVLALGTQHASAQLTKLTVGYSAISGDQLPAWVAKETGIFEKNGLDVQLVFFTGGTTAVMALVAADTPISQVAGAGVITSVLAGSDAVLVVGGVTSLNYYLMTASHIKTAEQLKGGQIAISRFGAASDFIARFALSKIGLTPGKDVTLVQIGSTGARMDATLAGRVQGTVINPPASFIAEQRGMNTLADLPKLGMVYQHTSAATTKKYIRQNPDIVRRYVKSQVEAVHRIYTDKETSIKVLSKYFGRGVERDILEKTWANLLNENVLPRKQYPSLEGIKTILETEAKGKPGKPEDFVDMTFVRELDKSGYVDALYKKK
jgi:NitT/TauT family transport system substrate-binding protein